MSTVMNHNRRELFTKFAPTVAIGALAVPMILSPAAALAGASGVTLIEPFRLQDSRTKEADKYDTTAADDLLVDGLVGHQGVLLNVTVTQTEGAGFFLICKEHQSPARTSSINWWGTGQTLANLAVVNVAGEPGIHVQGGGGGRAHLIIDVLGFIN